MGSGGPPIGPGGGGPPRGTGRVGRDEKGQESLLEGQEWLGGLPKETGRVGRLSWRASMHREALPE